MAHDHRRGLVFQVVDGLHENERYLDAARFGDERLEVADDGLRLADILTDLVDEASGSAEIVLHVDDDERRAASVHALFQSHAQRDAAFFHDSNSSTFEP